MKCGHILLFAGCYSLANAALLDIYIINGAHAACPAGYGFVAHDGGLNGDLNQGSDGAFLYLCVRYGSYDSEDPIENLAVVSGGSGSNCGSWNSSPHNSASNGDLNQGAGGNHIYMCYLRGRSKPIHDLHLTENACPSASYSRITHYGGTGDLNEGAEGKYIFVCQQFSCLATHVKGSWQPKYAITSAITETWEHGTAKSHSRSKTEDWSTSVSVSVSEGFELDMFSASVEISTTMSHSISRTYSSEWSTSTMHSFQVAWLESQIGKYAWQFVFNPSDSCGHSENTLTQEFALTDGAWSPPCCLPGYTTDIPTYKKCTSSDVMIPNAYQYGCQVASASEVEAYWSKSNRSRVGWEKKHEVSRKNLKTHRIEKNSTRDAFGVIQPQAMEVLPSKNWIV